MMFQETESVELKQDYAESIRKDIIAFANTNGGTIFVGIRDNGEVIGVSSPDQMIQRISNMVRDSIKPDVTMFVHKDREGFRQSWGGKTLLLGRKGDAAVRRICPAGNVGCSGHRGLHPSDDQGNRRRFV